MKGYWWKFSYLAYPKNKNDLTCNFWGKIAKGWAYINVI